MAKSKFNRAIAVLLLICVLAFVYLGVCGILFFRNKTLPVYINSQYDYLYACNILEQGYEERDVRTKEYYRNKVEKDLGLNFYFYKERKLSEYGGVTFPTIRLIVLDTDVSGYEYCVVFAHETIHLTQFIADERHVCYETFKYLYESEELHEVGAWYGYRQLYGYYNGEYNIEDLVVNYLTNK